MRDSQKKKFILNVLFLLAVALCLYVFFCCALCWLLPFVLGLAIAFCLKPATEWIARVTRMRRKPSAICADVLFYTLLGGPHLAAFHLPVRSVCHPSPAAP